MIRNNLLPALTWLGVSIFLIQPSPNPFSLLLIFRTAIIFGCLLLRDRPFKRGSELQNIVSWISTFLPCFLRAEFVPQNSLSLIGFILIILGTFVVGIACLDLGKSFGISPAVRPFVKQGVYNIIRHPMYTGHLICELGFVLANPSAFNILICVICWVLYSARAKWENNLFEQWQIGHTTSSGSK